MKHFTEKEVKSGDTILFGNEERDSFLEVDFCENIQHHTGHGFVMRFNGEFKSFKTFKTLHDNADKLIVKYKLNCRIL